MKFYEWFVKNIKNPDEIDVDTECYMIEAWNGAITSCLDEITQYVDCPPVVEYYLEKLKQSKDVF